MDVNKKLEETRDQIIKHLKANGKATQDDIVAALGLQKELVANVLTKYTDIFQWTLRGGDFQKEYAVK